MSSANLERLCESFDYDSDEYDYDDFGAYMRKAYDGYDDYDKSDYEDYLSDKQGRTKPCMVSLP